MKLSKMTLWKDSNQQLEQSREHQLSLLHQACNEYILEGFEFRGYTVHYSLEKQSNFRDALTMFNQDMITEYEVTVYDKEDAPCRVSLNKEQFTDLFIRGVEHKEQAIGYLRDVLQPQIEQATNEEELLDITWDLKEVKVYGKD